MSRTANSLKNLKFSVLFKLSAAIVNFLARKVFVLILTKDYLGLNDIFSNILSVLSLAELGVGTAIIFSLYKPLAENDRELVRSLMALYRKLYIIIGLTVALLGAALAPFLPYLIKDIPDIPHITLIYLLFVFNSSVSYFFVYKQSLIEADQKQYITTTYSYISNMVCSVLQCVLLLLTHRYLLYLGTAIATNVLNNLLLARKADRLYPYLKGSPAAPLPADVKRTITQNVRAMIMHKLGGVAVFGTDNLLIAYFAGAASVALYSNYLMVTKSLNLLYKLIFSSLTASVGNLNAAADRDDVRRTFWQVDRFTQWLYGFSSVCLFVLLNPFITLWLGGDWLFPMKLVFIISLNFYATGLRQGELVFREAMGLYWYDRYKPIAESLVNLVVSILLARRYDILGIFIGTFVSTMTVDFWLEPWILFRYGFQTRSGRYFLRYGLHTLLTLLAGFLAWELCALLPAAGFLPFVGKMAICAVTPNVLYLLAYGRSEEVKCYLDILRKLLRHRAV